MRYLAIKFLILLIGMVLVLPMLCAQQFDQNWKRLDQSTGISELQNAFFTADKWGQLWISSTDGLNSFDGKEVRQLRFSLPNGQSDPLVSSKMFPDAEGNLWCTSASGIHRLKHGTFQVDSWQIKVKSNEVSTQDQVDSIPATYHYGICLEQDSLLWVLADTLLYQFNINTRKLRYLHPLNAVRCYPILNSVGKVMGLAVSFFETGIEIIEYTADGKISRQSYFQSGQHSGMPEAKIYNFVVQQDSLAWLPSNIGLLRFNLKDKSFQRYYPEIAPKSIVFSDAAVWKHDFLWLSSVGNGIYLFSIKDRRFISNERFVWVDNQAHDVRKINNLYVDPGGTLWLANWNKEILFTHLAGLKFEHRLNKLDPGSATIAISSLAGGQDGNLWCALQNEGFCRLNESNTSLKGKPDFYAKTRRVNHLWSDEVGNLWQATDNKLCYLDYATGREYQVHKSDAYYREIAPISKNKSLVLTYKGFFILEKIAGKFQIKQLVSERGLAGEVITLLVSADKRLYASLLSNKIVELEIVQDSIKILKPFENVGFVNDMFEDQSGAFLWLASSSGLLKLMKTGAVEYVSLKHNQLSRSFNAVLQDDSNQLWLSSNAGLFQFNPDTKEVKHYTESDGLQSLQFMLGSACKLPDGRLAFGGVNGLNIFHPDLIRDNPNPPLLHFTDWIVNDTGSISTSPENLPRQSFSYDRRTLSFRFIGIDYTAPEEVQYKYRLKGFEEDTAEAGTNRLARYAQLPSGDYTFQVWAANSDGVWTENPHELHFSILPPWYATWLARMIQLLLFLGIMYAIYTNRIAAIKRKESEHRKEAEFRQKEAESKQLAAELQNSVLRLQMNPHFIFNSMNSISSYILQKDIDTANDYLGRFAKLMRRILDLSAKPLIPIADEIELLEQYMATEAMRFEQKFTWQIEVDPEIDPDEYMVPTMILQPFVENAIWHGFSRKIERGLIKISFLKKGEDLICGVEDNGVGRAASSQHRSADHPSKAVEITEQRLQWLENNRLDQPRLKIHDLYNDALFPCGTYVEVRLPLNL